MVTKIEDHPLLQRAKDIAAMVPYWNQVNAIVEGYEAIKAGGENFLPRFAQENDERYKFRLQSSKFTNIYRDVSEGLATKPFEEEISLIGGSTKEDDGSEESKKDTVEIPKEFLDFIEDVDGAGNNLTVFSALTFFNGINNAIDWIFVDYPTIDPNKVVTREAAKKANIKPYWSHVLATNVLEVRTRMVGGKEVLTYIRILEPASDVNSTDRVREIERNDADVVTWKLWKKVPNGETIEQQFVVERQGTLSINTIPLVPFATGRRDGRTFKFFPPMRDAADLQIKLYQNESALEYIKILACYPMLAANGMRPEKDKDGKPKELAIGPMQVMYGLPDGDGGHGTWSFIEPAANSMEFMQKNIAQTKQDLRELGRQPLTALSSQLTTVTTSIAAGKARSAVMAWTLMLKDALENALVITGMFMNSTEWSPQVNVYTGFDDVLDDGKNLEALISARENGDISQETFLFELKRNGVLSPEFNYEEEKKRLLDDVPVNEFNSDLNPDPAPPKPVAKKKSKSDAKP